jgi:putative transposase
MFPYGIGFRNTSQRKYLLLEKKIAEFIIDETLIKVGSEYVWLWVAIEPWHKLILGFNISKERNILIAERFLSHIVKEYGQHPVSTDGGTWYPQACQFLKLRHHIHSSYEKSLVERTMQYIKDRTKKVSMIIFLANEINVN